MKLFTPMRLASISEPFDSPDWLFELKYDGYRALAVVQDGTCKLFSRNLNQYKSFEPLSADIARCVTSDCVLDGEVVCLDPNGKPQFLRVAARCGIPCLLAFDIVSANGAA